MIRRILLALLPLAVVAVLASTGYALVWRWSLVEAVYMTVITIATVGYTEVRPLSEAGRVFTIGVIIAGIGAGTYALGRIVDIVVEEQLQGRWKERRMSKRIDSMSGHTIVAGLGRVGSVVVRELESRGVPFVVVDNCDECSLAAAERDWLFVSGDATEEEVLRRAGVEKAGNVVTALNGDADNLFVTVTARALNPGVFIVARSSHESSEEKLLKGGANRVLTPNVIGGRRMATMVLHPTVSDYLDLVSHGSGLEYRLQEVELRAGSKLDGMTIASARVRESTGAYILAVRHDTGGIDANPRAETVLHEGDTLVVLGTSQQVERLMSMA